jgi:hypothetical protein
VEDPASPVSGVSPVVIPDDVISWFQVLLMHVGREAEALDALRAYQSSAAAQVSGIQNKRS